MLAETKFKLPSFVFSSAELGILDNHPWSWEEFLHVAEMLPQLYLGFADVAK